MWWWPASTRSARPLWSREFQDAAPRAARQEYLLLDDHTDPARRDLVAALEGVGDAMRLVPRPATGRAAELDALSLSARSEFLVVSYGDRPPLNALGPALELLWSQGSDVVSLMGAGVDPGEGDSGSRLVDHLGFGTMGLRGLPGDRVVVIRRWVARWLFSEMDRALDPADEMADRARLLGLDLLVVDESGAPIR